MEPSEQPKKRRRTFEPATPEHGITAKNLTVLIAIARYGFLTLPQLVAITGISERGLSTHVRVLYDHKLVDKIWIHRSSLADADAPNDHRLMGGRAPTIYKMRPEGIKQLIEGNFLEREEMVDPPTVGPRNGLFLAHELEIRDVLAWFFFVGTRAMYRGLELWKVGTAAHIDLKRREFPREVRPDAQFVFGLGPQHTLAGFLEVDRGTEKRPQVWQDKFRQYEVLFASGLIPQVLGYQTGRILIITPNDARREKIAAILRDLMESSDVPVDRFWLTSKENLNNGDLTRAVWQVPERSQLLPLVQ